MQEQKQNRKECRKKWSFLSFPFRRDRLALVLFLMLQKNCAFLFFSRLRCTWRTTKTYYFAMLYFWSPAFFLFFLLPFFFLFCLSLSSIDCELLHKKWFNLFSILEQYMHIFFVLPYFVRSHCFLFCFPLNYFLFFSKILFFVIILKWKS